MSERVATGSRRFARLLRPTGFGLVTMITVIGCLMLFAWPVVMIVLGAFRGGSPGDPADWAWDPIGTVLTSRSTGKALGTSFVLATVVTITAKVFSFYFAWLVARTNTPLRQIITPIMLIVLTLPNLFFVLSWALLGQPQVGLVNQFIALFTGQPSTLVDTSTFGGIVFVAFLKSVSFGYFLLLGPFRALSHKLDEAAAVSGAGRFRTFWTINVPIMAPALGAALIMGFIVQLEAFEAPLILGTNDNVQVISTAIYDYLNDDFPPKYAEASGLAIIVLLILLVLLLVQRLVQRRRSYETIEGKSGADLVWDLGSWRFVGTALFVVYAALALVLPVLQVVISSLQPFAGATSGYSFANYGALFANPRTIGALANTAQLAVLAGLAVMLIGLLITFVARHARRSVGVFISQSTWLPFSMPGTAMALGILWVILSYPFTRGLYGTFAAMFIALVIVAMPLAMRNLEPAVMQVSPDLEEAAWISGRSKLRAFLDVVARLIIPSFLSGWLLCGIVVGGNLVMPLMVGSPLLDTVTRMTYDMYSAGKSPMAAALSCVFLLGIGVVYLVGIALRAVILKILARSASRTVLSAKSFESVEDGAAIVQLGDDQLVLAGGMDQNRPYETSNRKDDGNA